MYSMISYAALIALALFGVALIIRYLNRQSLISKHIYSKIESLFAGRISPERLQQLLKDPGGLNLKGARRLVTILYLEPGPSTFAYESFTPEQWSEYLNPYLTLVTGLVHKTGGMILNYEGTAVTAFWGAPLDSDGEAVNACHAALLIQDQLTSFNEDLESRNLPPISPLFAITTEELFVGDFGSDQLPQYSLLGDYRYILKALIRCNYESSTSILVTEQTKKMVAEEFALRSIGEGIRKKGFNELIPVYELMQGSDS